MALDLAFLEVEKVIFHEITCQKKYSQKTPPMYSEIESNLNDELRIFIREKIQSSIEGGKSHEVVFDDTVNPKIIKPIVDKLLTEKNPDFVSLSKEVANHLNNIQGGNSPGGLVTILLGKINETKVVGILKVEKEEGARLEQTKISGKPTYDIYHLKDIILGEKTRLFKVGLFYGDKNNTRNYDGKVCDTQIGYTQKNEVANFFLKNFLGCKLANDPQVETKDFFDYSQKFFDTKVNDNVKRVSYNLHLLSYVSGQSRTLNPRIFARTKLESGDRTPYENYLRDKKVPMRVIVRDISLIEKRIKDMVIVFENGLQIIGKKETFEENVALRDLDDGKTEAKIVSKIKNVRSK